MQEKAPLDPSTAALVREPAAETTSFDEFVRAMSAELRARSKIVVRYGSTILLADPEMTDAERRYVAKKYGAPAAPQCRAMEKVGK